MGGWGVRGAPPARRGGPAGGGGGGGGRPRAWRGGPGSGGWGDGGAAPGSGGGPGRMGVWGPCRGPQYYQKTAIGLTGEPVTRSSTSGATVSMNSQRRRRAHAC